MAFETPSMPELIARAVSDIEGSGGMRRSDAAVLARTHAASVYGLYQYQAWQFAQHRPDTCDEEHLARHAADRNVPRKQATYAAGYVAVVGNVGAEVNVGDRMERGGVLYEVVQGAALSAGAAAVGVQALDAGSAGNQPAGAKLQFISPVLGVESVATVDADGLHGGTELEALDDWRARVVEAFERVPHGGSADDYVAWAKEQPGVTRAWVKRNWVGPGTVGVFVVNDAATPITLTPAQLDEVKAGMQAKRPVTADLYLLTPELVPVPYTLGVTPDTPAVRAAVEASLQALHARSSELGGRLLHTHIGEAISGARGEQDHDLVIPAEDVVPEPHQLLEYGGVTWQ